jgi:hypothetical protein
MHAAVRSPLTAGIALCGASAIALTPIAPTMPALTEIQARAVASAEVALTAAANPIEQWAQVIQQAFVNGGVLAQNWAANPVPILRQLLTNQLGYGEQIAVSLQNSVNALVGYLTPGTSFGLWETLNRALTEIASGQIYAGTNTLFEAALGLVIGPAFPALGLLQIPVEMAKNFADVVAVLPNAVLGLGLGALGNVAGVVAAVGLIGQNVVDALSTGDIIGVFNAIVGAPATLVGAVLNGFPDTGAPGILSPGGLIDQLMGAANSIAVALGLAVPVAAQADTTLAKVSSVPDSVALSATTDTVETVTVSTTVTEEAVAEDPVTEDPVTEETVTEGTTAEEPSATTETTETGSGSTGEATTDNGGTDLSDGNKAEPGSAAETGTSGGDSGVEETESGTMPSGSTDAGSTESGDSSAGPDASDSSGDSE